MNEMTIVMYHYVRPIAGSKYPGIKGLEVSDFEGQIAYFKKHYQFVSTDDCLEALKTGRSLPRNSILLTFDDGFKDHVRWVLPVLKKNGIQAAFFPPSRAIQERKMLDVHKIQFILAGATPIKDLILDLDAGIDRARSEFQLPTTQELWKKWAEPTRFDPAEVVYFKRLLQRELPLELRTRLIDEIFGSRVFQNETAFAEDLYLNREDLATLIDSGMTVGSHGHEHFWLGKLDRQAQEKDIDASRRFLKSIGVPEKDWVMCYPYGSYNEDTLALLQEKNCGMAVTTEVRLAEVSGRRPFRLDRLDTNDFPKRADAPPNDWTKKVTA